MGAAGRYTTLADSSVVESIRTRRLRGRTTRDSTRTVRVARRKRGALATRGCPGDRRSELASCKAGRSARAESPAKPGQDPHTWRVLRRAKPELTMRKETSRQTRYHARIGDFGGR